MRKVALITNDKYFFKKCSLLLEGIAEVTENAEIAQLVARMEIGKDCRKLIISEGEGLRELSLPASLDELTAALTPDKKSARLLLADNRRGAFLDGEMIRLTESEAALLKALIAAGGEFVSREQILKSVFPGKTESMINVYIHYLRDKLERCGEKMIVASRDAGYRIERKFLGGEG